MVKCNNRLNVTSPPLFLKFQIKVVIIGQDPYHGPRQAHGMFPRHVELITIRVSNFHTNALVDKTKLHWRFNIAINWDKLQVLCLCTEQDKSPQTSTRLFTGDTEACVHKGNHSRLRAWLNNNAAIAMVMGKTPVKCKLPIKHEWIFLCYFYAKHQFCCWWFYLSGLCFSVPPGVSIPPRWVKNCCRKYATCRIHLSPQFQISI